MTSLNESRRVLVAAGTEKGQAGMRALLAQTPHADAIYVKTGCEARAALAGGEVEAVIIVAPLPDESGCGLAQECAAQDIGALLLMDAAHYEKICDKLTQDGIMVLQKPVSRSLFQQAMGLLAAYHNRVQRAAVENRKLKSKIEELRLVSRAKILLVEVLRMSEDQAHRYIERQAMDMRETKRKIAEEILKTYDN